MDRGHITLAIAIVMGLIGVSVTLYQSGKREGVRATVAEYARADKEGAENVTETSRRVLRDLGGVDDPIGLLCKTNGLRDAECDND